MPVEISRINPDQLHPTPGCHHITVVEAGRTAFLAGQCPLDHCGALVGPGDFDAQIDQVAANAVLALVAVGAQPSRGVPGRPGGHLRGQRRRHGPGTSPHGGSTNCSTGSRSSSRP
ncbi:hypothetical protein ACFRQM_02445 [Streptomyces sp. NPDC056831]|uniref:hypothetical protein n=1 Tax=Streptomyces sp. NPDC056831 TaxID=3345954 RepID=UPI0036C05CC1